VSQVNELSGAKGSSNSSKSYTNTADNLRSNDSFEILLGLGSGRWKGLVNGHRSFYINDVPLENEDRSSNFKDVSIIFADGDPSALQPVTFKLGGGGGITSVNTALANANGVGTPGPWVSAAVSTPGADFIDLRFIFQQLVKQGPNGVFEASATIDIEMRPSGSSTWVNPLATPTAPVIGYLPAGTTDPAYPGEVADGSYPYIDQSYGSTYKVYQSSKNFSPKTTSTQSLLSGASIGDFTSNWVFNLAPGSIGYVVGALNTTGKTMSPYPKELRIAVPNTGAYVNKTWEVRARLREPAHQYEKPNTEDQVETIRTLLFESVTAVSKQVLGNSEEWRGHVWLQLVGKASEQFNGFPQTRGIYDTKIVKVPPSSVFNPYTRTYTGAVWDGSTVMSYTNDPAWCIKDLIEDPISGIAAISPGATLDKWDALEISKYCSEKVSDGRGGLQPRFSMNVRLEQQMDANDLIQYLAGSFSGYAADSGGGRWRLKMDKPETPVATFTLDNIFGEFSYSHTDVDTRFNDITVAFINEENNYQEDRVRVYDQANIDLYGQKPTQIVAVGCTNRQEAMRRAVLRLRTSLNENKIVKFVTNRFGRYLEPLQTILVADQHLGYMPPTGSQVQSDSDPFDNRTTSRVATLDEGRSVLQLGRSVRLEPGVNYTLKLTVPNPNYNPEPVNQPTNPTWKHPTTVVTAKITNNNTQRGDVMTLYVDEPLPANTPQDVTIALSADGLPTLPIQYRIIEISPSEGEEVTISAIIVDTGKHVAADNVTQPNVAAWLQTGRNYGAPPMPSVPTWGMFRLTEFFNLGIEQRMLSINWQRPASLFHDHYIVERQINQGGWEIVNNNMRDDHIEVINPPPGYHEYRIQAVDRRGVSSLPLYGFVSVPAWAPNGEIDQVELASGGPLANRPSTNVTEGQLYFATDQLPIQTFFYTGGQWRLVATAGSDINNMNVYDSASGTALPLTRAQLLTILGTAAGVTGQGPFATDPRQPEALFSPNPNILYNGGFRLRLNGWTGPPNLFSWTAGAGEGAYTYTNGTTGGITSTPFGVYAGETYFLQAELYSYDITNGAIVTDIQWYKDSAGTIPTDTGSDGDNLFRGKWGTDSLAAWGRVTKATVAPPGAVSARIRCFAENVTYRDPAVNVCAWRKVKVSRFNQDSPFTDEATNGALYFDGTSVDILRPAEPAADVTSYIQQVDDVNISADYTGAVKATELPHDIPLKLIRNGVLVTTGVNWYVQVLSGGYNGLTTANGSVALAIGVGAINLTINSIQNTETRLRVTATYGALSRTMEFKILQQNDAPPATGSTGGTGGTGDTGGSVSSASISTFTPTGGSSTTYGNSINQLPNINTGPAGTITFTAPMFYRIVGRNDEVMATMWGKWQYRTVGGTWVDAGPEQVASTPAENEVDPEGFTYKTPGSIKVNITITGLAVNTVYETRILFRDDTSIVSVQPNGTATAQGS